MKLRQHVSGVRVFFGKRCISLSSHGIYMRRSDVIELTITLRRYDGGIFLQCQQTVS